MFNDSILRKGKIGKFFFFSSNSVFYRLTMAFGLFFLCPFLALLFLALKTDLLGSEELLYCVAGLLVSTLIGYVILRQISEGIARVEKNMIRKMDHLVQIGNISGDEISNISFIADVMNDKMENVGVSLERRINEIHTLNELNSISLADSSAYSLLRIALKRALTLLEASDGAILFVKENQGICLEAVGKPNGLTVNESFRVANFPFSSARRQKGPLLFSSIDPRATDSVGSASCLLLIGVLREKSLYVLINEPDAGFSDEMCLNFLGMYFSAVGTKLKMAEIDRREQRTSNELNTMHAIISILNTFSDERKMLASIAQKIDTILPHKWIGLVQKNVDSASLYLSHSFSNQGNTVETGAIIREENSHIRMAMLSDEPILVDNPAKMSLYEKLLCSRMQLHSVLFARLNSNGRSVGTLCLGRGKERGFSPRDKRLFTLVANGFSAALEQARAVGRRRAKQVELEVLRRIGEAISSHTIRAEKILPYVLEKVTGLVDVEAGNIMMMEFDSLQVVAVHGNLHKNLLKQRFRLSSGVAGYVVSTGDPVVIEDVNDYPDFKSAIDEKTEFETRTLLCVPMISGGQVVGVIELLNRRWHPFSDEDIQTVKAVAASVALALENTRLYEQFHYVAEKERYIRSIFQRYVPGKIVAEILQENDNKQMNVGQKRVVTVFNVDIRGYSKLSKQASTEEVVDVLNYFFKQMGEIVLKHKGIVDKYLGDGMLAIFGVPVSSSNPALDAVLAAQEMVAIIDKVSAYSFEQCGVPLAVGISINTGEAIVGNIGFAKKMEYTVIGGVVNETFRIQDLTREKKNMVLVGKSTYRQVKSHVRTMYYGLKKFDASMVEVYEIVAGKDAEERERQRKVVPLQR